MHFTLTRLFFQAPVHMNEKESTVACNGVIIECDGAVQTILIFVCCHLAFNLEHQPNQEATLEALEGMMRIRRRFTKLASKNFLKTINVC